jgi:hypothetical protein
MYYNTTVFVKTFWLKFVLALQLYTFLFGFLYWWSYARLYLLFIILRQGIPVVF